LAVGVVSEAADLGDGGRVHAFAGAGHGDGAEFAEDCVGVEGFEVGAAAGAGFPDADEVAEGVVFKFLPFALGGGGFEGGADGVAGRGGAGGAADGSTPGVRWLAPRTLFERDPPELLLNFQGADRNHYPFSIYHIPLSILFRVHSYHKS